MWVSPLMETPSGKVMGVAERARVRERARRSLGSMGEILVLGAATINGVVDEGKNTVNLEII